MHTGNPMWTSDFLVSDGYSSSSDPIGGNGAKKKEKIICLIQALTNDPATERPTAKRHKQTKCIIATIYYVEVEIEVAAANGTRGQ